MTFTMTKPLMKRTRNGVSWNANLWRDGRYVAEVYNAGNGGCDGYHWAIGDPNNEDDMQAFADAAEAWNKENPGMWFGEKMCAGRPSPDFCAGYVESLMQASEGA